MKLKNILSAFAISLLVASCQDATHEGTLAFENAVTFNKEENGLDIEVPSYGFVIPSSSYTARAYRSGSITLNVSSNSDGTHNGFALSSKNSRSYPWATSMPFGYEQSASELKASVDTTLFSVYTTYPNTGKNFTVCRVSGDDAYFTIDKPRVVEHILVANTTYNYLIEKYGSMYSGTLDSGTQVYVPYKSGTTLSKVKNPNMPDGSSTKYGVWYLPDYYNFNNGEDYVRLEGQQILARKAAGDETICKAWVKLIAKGYLNGSQTGTSEYYISTLTGNAPEPYSKWNIIQDTWAAWDLTELGTVDKVVFYMESSDTDANGVMHTPPYFCMDGVRLSE